MVRTYAPYSSKKQRSQAGDKTKYRERTSDEWDVRIDCDPAYADEIVNNLRNAANLLKYCLVSGIEMPDSETINGAKERHVHIALVFHYNLRRDQALATCRGLTKKTDEYACPRNRKFTYAGWYMHHTKLDQKVVLEKAIRYEAGVLPEDPVNDDTKKAILKMYKKFGCDDTTSEQINKIKFLKYLE